MPTSYSKYAYIARYPVTCPRLRQRTECRVGNFYLSKEIHYLPFRPRDEKKREREREWKSEEKGGRDSGGGGPPNALHLRNAPTCYISYLSRRRKRSKSDVSRFGSSRIYTHSGPANGRTFRSPPRNGFPEAVGTREAGLSREGTPRGRQEARESGSRSPRRTAPHCTAVLHPDRTCGPASLLGPLAGPRCWARDRPLQFSSSQPRSFFAHDSRRAFSLWHHLLPTLPSSFLGPRGRSPARSVCSAIVINSQGGSDWGN